MKSFAFSLLLLLALSCRADGLPDLGDISQASISLQQERQIGEQSMFEIRANRSYLDDAEIADYLQQLGYQLVANSSEPGQEFEFFAINDNTVNAFALPGGFIGVNAGLILTAQSESELASVLSHEIAHVTQHHIARMVAGQKVDSIAAMVTIAAVILAARSNPDASQAAIAGVQAGAIQRQLNFTRTHEQEADRLGLEILQKANFDSHAMPAFLLKLQKATYLMEGNAPTYLRTHPVTTDRIADIDGRLQKTPYRLVADSLSFHLVRAKLQAAQKTPKEALTFFTNALGPRKHGNPIAQRYGLVLALLRNNQPARAVQEFTPLQTHVTKNPMIATLAGQLRLLDKNDKGTISFYRTATQNFPQHRALTYNYAEMLLQTRKFEDALKLLNEQVISHPSDSKLFELQARAYTALGKRHEEHRALAYAYALHGNLYGAIEQLELAKQAGGSFYQLSIIESELKELREFVEARTRK